MTTPFNGLKIGDKVVFIKGALHKNKEATVVAYEPYSITTGNGVVIVDTGKEVLRTEVESIAKLVVAGFDSKLVMPTTPVVSETRNQHEKKLVLDPVTGNWLDLQGNVWLPQTALRTFPEVGDEVLILKGEHKDETGVVTGFHEGDLIPFDVLLNGKEDRTGRFTPNEIEIVHS